MKFQLILTSALAGVAPISSASQASSEASLTGNVITDMVAEYMYTCALNPTGGMQLDQQSCLSKELLKMMFSKTESTPSRRLFESNTTFFMQDFDERKLDANSTTNNEGGTNEEDECSPPPVDEGMIREMVGSAGTHCAASSDEIEAAVSLLTEIFGSTHCWESLCSEDFGMTILSSWLESCANIELPYPLPHPEQMAADPELYEPDVKLGCMLDYVMSSNHSMFGLEEPTPGSIESCYPPEHADPANFCSSEMGPAALRHCKNVTLFGPSHDDVEDPFTDYGGMSYFFGRDYSLSYGFDSEDDFEEDLSYKYGDEEELTKDRLYIDNLCEVVMQLSSEQGKSCLDPLCEMDDGESGESIPSMAPTRGDSAVLASSTPSLAPSMAPSVAVQTTSAPTLSPTMAPTKSPVVQTTTALKITFEAEIQMNGIDANDVPNPGPELVKFVAVLENAITRLLPADASARILRINGNPVNQRRRRLESVGFSIAFEITMKLPCDKDDCSDAKKESDTVYSDVSEDLEESVSDGRLESNIQEEASVVGVRQLETASVKADSFSATEAETTVENTTEEGTEVVDGTEESGAKGKMVAALPSSIVAGAVALIYITL